MNTQPTALVLERDVLGEFAPATTREWLVTNGIGGYAAGSIGFSATRRYHGLLVAALRPPLERTLMVAKCDAFVHYRGKRVALSTNQYLDGTIDPHGYRHLVQFRLEGQVPVWRWCVDDALVEARLWMPHGRNTTCLQWSVLAAGAPLELELAPLCTYRDYHWHSRGARDIAVTAVHAGMEIRAGGRAFRIVAEGAQCVIDPGWHWNLSHRHEAARGLDDGEDLLCPGTLRIAFRRGDERTVVLDAEPGTGIEAAASLRQQRARELHLLQRAKPRDAVLRSPAERQRLQLLVLAADQFIVERQDRSGVRIGETVIAGYPWFGDWGRDTMIALPGLALATGRTDSAASILRTFARFVDQGLLPNRFPDAGEAPEYNTVDATLWYVVAIEATWRATRDHALLAELYPVLCEIVEWHRRGTRHGIRVDHNDGLLMAGEPGVQLTWMDAKVGDHVITQRSGKPVEINALWFNTLCALREMAVELGHPAQVRDFAAQAARAAASFNERFWNESAGCLYDVIDGPEGELDHAGRRVDPSLRPNQLFAVSLAHPLLDAGRARKVVEACARELWTPLGLRSLAQSDPRYCAHYAGGVAERDGAYHQGTVWSWLLGPFAQAHLRVFGDADAAARLLEGIDGHLREACVGQLSEIFDGDAPHAARGCFAQAWSVAEILRAWRTIDDYRHEQGAHESRATGIARRL